MTFVTFNSYWVKACLIALIVNQLCVPFYNGSLSFNWYIYIYNHIFFLYNVINVHKEGDYVEK